MRPVVHNFITIAGFLWGTILSDFISCTDNGDTRKVEPSISSWTLIQYLLFISLIIAHMYRFPEQQLLCSDSSRLVMGVLILFKAFIFPPSLPHPALTFS